MRICVHDCIFMYKYVCVYLPLSGLKYYTPNASDSPASGFHLHQPFLLLFKHPSSHSFCLNQECVFPCERRLPQNLTFHCLQGTWTLFRFWPQVTAHYKRVYLHTDFCTALRVIQYFTTLNHSQRQFCSVDEVFLHRQGVS